VWLRARTLCCPVEKRNSHLGATAAHHWWQWHHRSGFAGRVGPFAVASALSADYGDVRVLCRCRLCVVLRACGFFPPSPAVRRHLAPLHQCGSRGVPILAARAQGTHKAPKHRDTFSPRGKLRPLPTPLPIASTLSESDGQERETHLGVYSGALNPAVEGEGSDASFRSLHSKWMLSRA
jgi:hypothetical protein